MKKKETIKALIGTNVRDLLKQANDLEITKDMIISIFKEEGQFFLIYIN